MTFFLFKISLDHKALHFHAKAQIHRTNRVGTLPPFLQPYYLSFSATGFVHRSKNNQTGSFLKGSPFGLSLGPKCMSTGSRILSWKERTTEEPTQSLIVDVGPFGEGILGLGQPERGNA
jgi:hypothetical protein